MDTKAVAVKSLENAFKIFLADLEAMPEEAFTKKFSEKTRTVADIVYEVNLVNDHVGMAIRGEEGFPWPEGGWITAPEGFNTKVVVIDAFKASSDKIIATANNLTPEQLDETVETEHGPSTRFARCQFIALHTWYHSGQLNFIQTLIGDDAWHW